MQDRQRAGRCLPALTAAIMAGGLAGNAPPAGQPVGQDVGVTATGLRSSKGQILACLTARPDAFPDCSKDPKALSAIVAAGLTVRFAFRDVAPGTYAISLLHDENGNGKADKALILPKEGFGFSRDAKLRMGPPRFAAAAFTVGSDPVHQQIRMRYLF